MPLAASMLTLFGEQYCLSAPVLHDMNVVLDDALNNIIAYGYDAGDESEITIRLEHRQGEVVLLIEDCGRPFDPTQAPVPELGASLQSRETGGLGIHFIRSLMDDVGYTHRDGINRLRMTKKVTD
jgi:serine/threonine-protein kinase RsbW